MITSEWYCDHCGAANTQQDQVCFACSHDRSQNAASVPPKLLHGRYRPLTVIGLGGFGVVYKAEDTHDADNPVAIKQINLRGLTSQEAIEATDTFNREIELLSHLAHAHLPRVYEHFTDPNHWYLVMDFINGETLDTYLQANSQQKGKARPLALSEVLDIALQLCDVLHYLHTRQPPIIFRDLKPGNIMRTARGQLYLIDFGIARYFKPGKSKDTIPLGSPGYAAPEQYGKAQTTPRTDIYSLGALIHTLLSGDDPADNPFHFAPLRLYGQDELPDIEKLVQHMVRLDAALRPANIEEVEAELRRIQEIAAPSGQRIWYPPQGQAPPQADGKMHNVYWPSASAQQQMMQQQASVAPQKTRRRQFLAWGAAATIGIALAASYLSNNLSVGASHSPAYNPPDQAAASHTASPPDLLGKVMALSLSADDSTIACIDSGGLLQLWNARNMQVVGKLRSQGSDAVALALSPNGQQLAIGYQNEPMMIFNVLQSGVIDTRYQGISVNIDALAWSPDGTFLAEGSSTDSTIRIWRSATYDLLHSFRLDKGNVSALAWLDSHLLAVGDSQGHIYVWDIFNEKTLHTYTIAQHGGKNKQRILSLNWSQDGHYLAAGSEDGYLRAWDTDTGRQTVNINTQSGALRQVVWSPDNTFIATFGEDVSSIIQVWQLNRKQAILSELWNDNHVVLRWPAPDHLLAVDAQNVDVWYVAPVVI